MHYWVAGNAVTGLAHNSTSFYEGNMNNWTRPSPPGFGGHALSSGYYQSALRAEPEDSCNQVCKRCLCKSNWRMLFYVLMGSAVTVIFVIVVLLTIFFVGPAEGPSDNSTSVIDENAIHPVALDGGRPAHNYVVKNISKYYLSEVIAAATSKESQSSAVSVAINKVEPVAEIVPVDDDDDTDYSSIGEAVPVSDSPDHLLNDEELFESTPFKTLAGDHPQHDEIHRERSSATTWTLYGDTNQARDPPTTDGDPIVTLSPVVVDYTEGSISATKTEPSSITMVARTGTTISLQHETAADGFPTKTPLMSSRAPNDDVVPRTTSKSLDVGAEFSDNDEANPSLLSFLNVADVSPNETGDGGIFTEMNGGATTKIVPSSNPATVLREDLPSPFLFPTSITTSANDAQARLRDPPEAYEASSASEQSPARPRLPSFEGITFDNTGWSPLPDDKFYAWLSASNHHYGHSRVVLNPTTLGIGRPVVGPLSKQQPRPGVALTTPWAYNIATEPTVYTGAEVLVDEEAYNATLPPPLSLMDIPLADDILPALFDESNHKMENPNNGTISSQPSEMLSLPIMTSAVDAKGGEIGRDGAIGAIFPNGTANKVVQSSSPPEKDEELFRAEQATRVEDVSVKDEARDRENIDLFTAAKDGDLTPINGPVQYEDDDDDDEKEKQGGGIKDGVDDDGSKASSDDMLLISEKEYGLPDDDYAWREHQGDKGETEKLSEILDKLASGVIINGSNERRRTGSDDNHDGTEEPSQVVVGAEPTTQHVPASSTLIRTEGLAEESRPSIELAKNQTSQLIGNVSTDALSTSSTDASIIKIRTDEEVSSNDDGKWRKNDSTSAASLLPLQSEIELAAEKLSQPLIPGLKKTSPSGYWTILSTPNSTRIIGILSNSSLRLDSLNDSSILPKDFGTSSDHGDANTPGALRINEATRSEVVSQTSRPMVSNLTPAPYGGHRRGATAATPLRTVANTGSIHNSSASVAAEAERTAATGSLHRAANTKVPSKVEQDSETMRISSTISSSSSSFSEQSITSSAATATDAATRASTHRTREKSKIQQAGAIPVSVVGTVQEMQLRETDVEGLTESIDSASSLLLPSPDVPAATVDRLDTADRRPALQAAKFDSATASATPVSLTYHGIQLGGNGDAPKATTLTTSTSAKATSPLTTTATSQTIPVAFVGDSSLQIATSPSPAGERRKGSISTMATVSFNSTGIVPTTTVLSDASEIPLESGTPLWSSTESTTIASDGHHGGDVVTIFSNVEEPDTYAHAAEVRENTRRLM